MTNLLQLAERCEGAVGDHDPIERAAAIMFERTSDMRWKDLDHRAKEEWRHLARGAAIAFEPLRFDDDLVLPCDVRIPPATTIKAGCPLSTLLSAMHLEGRPRTFPER